MQNIRYRSIDIFRLDPDNDSLLADLTLTAPAHLDVVGVESFQGRMSAYLRRGQPPHVPLTRTWGSLPRGEFDLWDAGAELLIRDQLPHPLHLLNVRSYDPGEGFALVPVRTTEQDLVAARRIASSTIFSGAKSAFLIVNETETCSHRLEELASLGPVLPMRIGHRKWAPVNGPVAVSPVGVTEAEAIWGWLRSFVDLA